MNIARWHLSIVRWLVLAGLVLMIIGGLHAHPHVFWPIIVLVLYMIGWAIWLHRAGSGGSGPYA